MSMIFFYFLKIIFNISTSKRSKKYKPHSILIKKIKKFQNLAKHRLKHTAKQLILLDNKELQQDKTLMSPYKLSHSDLSQRLYLLTLIAGNFLSLAENKSSHQTSRINSLILWL